MFISKFNKKEFKNYKALSLHVKSFGYSLEEYLVKYENFEIPKCQICGNKAANKCGVIYRKTCGSLNCLKVLNSQKILSEETKEKIRVKRHEFLKKNTGQTAWERKAAGKLSFLEEWFFKNVIEEFALLEKFDIINEYSIYPYFIDFAFLNIKLAVELDGACHFSNGGNRIIHDSKKDNHLLSLGWTVFRISYKELNDDTIKKFMNYINSKYKLNNKVLSGILHQRISIKPKPKYGSRHAYTNALIILNMPKNEKRIQQLLNSNIVFSKFGWVKKAGELLNISPQKVNNWMKHYMNDFYQEQCFKRR